MTEVVFASGVRHWGLVANRGGSEKGYKGEGMSFNERLK